MTLFGAIAIIQTERYNNKLFKIILIIQISFCFQTSTREHKYD